MTQNENNSPKTNFYLWQNSKWLDNPNNKIPSDYSSWGTFEKLRDNSLKQQIEILQELSEKHTKKKKDLNEDEIKLAIIYSKRLNKYENWDNNIGDYIELKKELSELQNNINTKNILSFAEVGSWFCKNGINFLLEFDKSSDMQKVEDMLLDLAPGHLSLPTRDYYFDEKFNKQRELYKKHLKNIYQLLKNNNILLSDNFDSDVFEFEKMIAYIQMSPAQSRLYDQYYTKTTLEGVYNNIENHNFVKEKLNNYSDNEKKVNLTNSEREKAKQFFEVMYNKLNLRFHMKNNYQNKLSPNSTNKDKAFDLTIYDGDYFVRLFKILLDEKNLELCYSWLQYNVVKSFGHYCTKQLNDEIFDFYSRKLRGQVEQKSNQKRAVEVVNNWVGELLGKIYVKKNFSEESKKDIIHMIDNVLDVMKHSLENNDWLTKKTQENAIKKLSSFVKKIGYPDVWKDFSSLQIDEKDSLFEIRNKVEHFFYTTEFLEKINTPLDRKKWLMTPQTINAYYHPQLNEIVFPAAILQPPFYQSKYTDIEFSIESKVTYEKLKFDPLVPINHGGIIAVIAHEITHGYDDQGRKFDHEGNMVDWWTEEDTKLFTKKIKHMVKQANNYKYKDVDGKTHKMNAELTMGENLADLGGLTLSLKALLKDKMYDNPEAIKLFFKSWANVWKTNIKEESKIDRLVSDPHAPADFRTNLVKNIDLFHVTFDVQEKDDMWLKPNDRVRMW